MTQQHQHQTTPTEFLSEREMVALDSQQNTPILPSADEDPEQPVEDVEDDPEEEVEVEETRYGWMVVAASFLCNLVIDGKTRRGWSR